MLIFRSLLIFIGLHTIIAILKEDHQFISDPFIQKLFNIFKNEQCTFLFSVKMHQTWTNLHSSLIEFCANSGDSSKDCIVLFSKQSHQNNITSSEGTLLEEKHFKGYEDFLPIDYLLSHQRFIKVCLVYIASAIPIEEDFYLQHDWIDYEDNKELSIYVKMPDYYLAKIPGKINKHLEHICQAFSFDPPWQLFLFYEIENKIQVRFSTNKYREDKRKYFDKYHVFPNLLTKIPFKVTRASLQEQSNLWQKGIFTENFGRPDKLAKGSFFREENFNQQFLELIIEMVMKSLGNNSIDKLPLGLFQRHQQHLTRYRLVPQTVEWHGLKYCVFKAKTHKMNNFQRVLTLAKPFSSRLWLIYFLAFLLNYIVLKASFSTLKFKNPSAFFWLFSTTVEQGNDGPVFKNKRHWYLLITWLYFVLLLRNLYTSSMYSYITKCTGNVTF